MKDKRSQESARVALLTPYDGGNLGDSAIQEAIIANLRRCDPYLDFLGITLSAPRTAARHQIPCYPLTAMSRSHYQMRREPANNVADGGEASAGLYKRLRRMARAVPFIFWLKVLTDESMHVFRSYRLLRKVDVLVIAGGGQLDDEWGGSWGHPYALAKWSVLARAARSSVVFLSVGACRIESRLTRMFLKTALSMACYRSYRDTESRRLVVGITSRADGEVVPDLAFSLFSASTGTKTRFNSAAVRVGISPIAYGHSGLWPTPDQVQYERYMTELACFVTEILRSGASVTLFSSSPPDDQIFADLRKHLNAAIDCTLSGRLSTRTADTVAELLDVLHSVDFVVASRLHGVLLSFLSGTPAIAISYDRKVTSLMEALGQAEYCLNIHSFKSDDLLERFFALRAHSKVIQSTVAATCRQYNEVLEKQYREITRLALARFRRNGDLSSREKLCDKGPVMGRPGINPATGPRAVIGKPEIGNRDEISHEKR